MNNRETGSRFENEAASFFIEKGYEILERNYRRKTGEIDLIVTDHKYLVFVEVKYRKSTQKGFPEEAVDKNNLTSPAAMPLTKYTGISTKNVTPTAISEFKNLSCPWHNANIRPVRRPGSTQTL